MLNVDSLNHNLLETENIISSKYRFRFVDLIDESIGNTDLMMNILQARVITEGICRFIVLNEHIVKDEKSIRTATLKVYIDDLLRPTLLIPKDIIVSLATIQSISNLTVHYQIEGYLDLNQMYSCLGSLDTVLNWFVKRYSSENVKNNRWKVSSDMLNKSGAVPPKAEGCIISRESEIEEIRTNILSKKIVILYGDTGVGKTELAKDYVIKYQKKYDGIYYAENIDELEDYIYDLPIGIIDEEIKTKKEIVEEKLNFIHSLDFTYLFIIDNYTGPKEDIYRLFPKSNEKYHLMVLVGEDYKTDEESYYYEVNSFSQEDSLLIFRHYCEKKYEDDEINKLLEYLSYNPRAIKMSAVFLQDNDSCTLYNLMESMKKNFSIKSVMQNLYTVLTEFSILEKDENIKTIAECLSLIPYNGVSKDRFVELMYGALKIEKNEDFVEEELTTLEEAGWMNIDNMGYITMNPLLSDTIFEKTHPDMTSETIVNFISPILKPTRNLRELFMAQVIALEPFVEHLTKRAERADRCDLAVLNDLREYYLETYELSNVELVTKLMEKEFSRHKLINNNIVENAIYRQGISRFNLEDFKEAHIHFERSLNMLNDKKTEIEKMIARISAYDGSSLAALGDKEKAIETAKRSVDIREKLGRAGDQNEECALWISHYNFAKTLLELKMFERANQEIDIATSIYTDYYPEEYKMRKSINVSSLFQLKGRILSGLGKYEEAIKLLEDAKTIREELKGETYFSTAQVYSYLMNVYSEINNYQQSLKYAILYHDVLITLHKTDDILEKIKDVEDKISVYRRNIDND